MIPYKTRRGKIALNRLKVFEGIPPPYDKQKRVCVPLAMKILCLRSDRKYCQVGRVAHEVGWQYRDVVSSLEAKRKIKARLHYNHKQRLEVRKLFFLSIIHLLTLFFYPINRNSALRPHRKSPRESPSRTLCSRSSDSLLRKMKSSPSQQQLKHKRIALEILYLTWKWFNKNPSESSTWNIRKKISFILLFSFSWEF